MITGRLPRVLTQSYSAIKVLAGLTAMAEIAALFRAETYRSATPASGCITSFQRSGSADFDRYSDQSCDANYFC